MTSGNPCALGILEDANGQFHPDVISQLSQIDSPSFQPRMFCWAATGSPFLAPDDLWLDQMQE
jgi:hypothetical protein